MGKNNRCKEIIKMTAFVALIVGVTYFVVEPFCFGAAATFFNSEDAGNVASCIVIILCAYLSFRVVARGIRRICGASGCNGGCCSAENVEAPLDDGGM